MSSTTYSRGPREFKEAELEYCSMISGMHQEAASNGEQQVENESFMKFTVFTVEGNEPPQKRSSDSILLFHFFRLPLEHNVGPSFFRADLSRYARPPPRRVPLRRMGTDTRRAVRAAQVTAHAKASLTARLGSAQLGSARARPCSLPGVRPGRAGPGAERSGGAAAAAGRPCPLRGPGGTAGLPPHLRPRRASGGAAPLPGTAGSRGPPRNGARRRAPAAAFFAGHGQRARRGAVPGRAGTCSRWPATERPRTAQAEGGERRKEPRRCSRGRPPSRPHGGLVSPSSLPPAPPGREQAVLGRPWERWAAAPESQVCCHLHGRGLSVSCPA
ncbi:unnamed protein product, partial [Coccothraustes coccothraustes]